MPSTGGRLHNHACRCKWHPDDVSRAADGATDACCRCVCPCPDRCKSCHQPTYLHEPAELRNRGQGEHMGIGWHQNSFAEPTCDECFNGLTWNGDECVPPVDTRVA